MKPDQLNAIYSYGMLVYPVQWQFLSFIHGCANVWITGNKGGDELKKYSPDNYG
jgi:hypothetical protein